MATSSSKQWSETRNGRIAVALCVIGLFALVLWLATKSRQMVSATSPLVVDEQYLSFGEVWEDSSFVWTLPIRNTANQDVEIATFATDCTCGKVEPSALIIPAKGTKDVSLTLDLRNRNNETDYVTREFKVFIQPRISKGPGLQSSWRVNGTVRSTITFTPRRVDFEDHLVRGRSIESIIVQARCRAPIARLIVSGGEPFAQLHTTKIDQTTDSFQMTVTPSSTLREGLFHTDAFVQPITIDGVALPKLNLPITGVVLPSVQFTPTRVLLGARDIGETVIEVISARLPSKIELTVDKTTSDSNSVIVNSLGKDEEGNHKYQLQVQVTKEGNHQIDVVFHVRGEDQGSAPVTLPVRYFGIVRGRAKR